MLKAFVSVTLSDLVLMFPVGLLYYLVGDFLNDTISSAWVPFYLIGSIICLVLIAITTYVQYNATFFAAYVESGVRRTTLAEKLRKLPLSFFGKKDLADLTSTIMSDCVTLETVRDLKANNAQAEYMNGLEKKIRAVESHAIVNGSLDVLTYFMFLLLVSRLYDPMQISLQNLAAIIAAEVQCERMDEILSAKTLTGEEKLTNRGSDIVFKHVGFTYNGEKSVLSDVSFTAKQGEVTALIGPSGGGKTTVSRLAARFWDINKGKIKVGGMNVSKVDPETLMSLYAIVFQDVPLFNNTVLENIRIG